MAAQTTHFFQGKAKAGRPLDHGPAPSAAVSSPLSPPNAGFSPITAQSSTVAAHHERGELDGAEEVNGG